MIKNINGSTQGIWNRRVSAVFGESQEDQEYRLVYKRVLEYEQDENWLTSWREKLRTQPKDRDVIRDLISEILKCSDHPLTQLLKSYQYKVYERIYPLVARNFRELDNISVPLNDVYWLSALDVCERQISKRKADAELKRKNHKKSPEKFADDVLISDLTDGDGIINEISSDSSLIKTSVNLNPTDHGLNEIPSAEMLSENLKTEENLTKSITVADSSITQNDQSIDTNTKADDGLIDVRKIDEAKLDETRNIDQNAKADNNKTDVRKIDDTKLDEIDGGKTKSTCDNLTNKILDSQTNVLETKSLPNLDSKSQTTVETENTLVASTSNISNGTQPNVVQPTLTNNNGILLPEQNINGVNLQNPINTSIMDKHKNLYQNLICEDMNENTCETTNLNANLRNENPKIPSNVYNTKNRLSLEFLKTTQHEERMIKDIRKTTEEIYDEIMSTNDALPDFSRLSSVDESDSPTQTTNQSHLAIQFDNITDDHFIKMTNDAYTIHLETLKQDIHRYMEKLLVIFVVSFEDLDSSEGRDLCYAYLEVPFFTPLWKYIIALFRMSNLQNELCMSVAMSEFIDVTPQQMAVKEKLSLTNELQPYLTSIEQLHSFITWSTPLCKLESLVSVTQSICQCMEDYYNKPSTTDTKPSIGADELIPILTYVVMRSGLPQIVSECHALEEFVHEGYLMGEEGYCLTSLQTAANYIISLGEDILHRRMTPDLM